MAQDILVVPISSSVLESPFLGSLFVSVDYGVLRPVPLCCCVVTYCVTVWRGYQGGTYHGTSAQYVKHSVVTVSGGLDNRD